MRHDSPLRLRRMAINFAVSECGQPRVLSSLFVKRELKEIDNIHASGWCILGS